MRVFSNINCPLKLKYAYVYFYFNPFSVQSRFTMYHYTSMHTHICTYVSDARAIYIMQIDFAEVKVLQQQNMLNVYHMHTWVCTVFKWNYEQHLYTHTLIPIINRFASTNKPLNIYTPTEFLQEITVDGL